MKNILYIIAAFLIIAPSTALAFGAYDPFNLGGAYNPLNVTVQPSASYQTSQSQQQIQYTQNLINAAQSSNAPATCRAILANASSYGGSVGAYNLANPADMSSFSSHLQYLYAQYIQCVANAASTYTPPVYYQQPNVYTAPQPCPDHASKGTNGSCFCDSGFTAQNGQCVSNDVLCQSSYGANSVSTGTTNAQGGQECACASGYQWNDAKTSCVLMPAITCAHSTNTNGKCVCDSGFVMGQNGCVSYDQSCKTSYGSHSVWLGTMNAQNGLNCGCGNGYDWSSEKNSCVSKSTLYTAICKRDYGSRSIWNGVINDNGGPTCDCETGYQWDASRKFCVVISQEPLVVPYNQGQPQEITDATSSPPADIKPTHQAPQPVRGFWSKFLSNLLGI